MTKETDLERTAREWLEENLCAMRTGPAPMRRDADARLWGVFAPILLGSLPKRLEGRREENPAEVIQETVGNAFEIARLVVERFDKLLADYRAGAV